MRRVYDNILQAVGDTPIVRLNQVAQDLPHNVYAKCEFLNPAGSIKDRIAIKIVEQYEKEGLLRRGGTIVEATSGNTGAGLALVGAIKRYKTIFVLPDKQSEEKRAALRAWGAQVVVTPTDVEPDDPRSYYKTAERIAAETPNSAYANQYHNPSNPQAHYEWTGPELYEQMDGKIDMLVVGLGTGGTVTGIAKYLKEKNPQIKVVGVDPVGSLYYDYFHTGQFTTPFSYLVEGIGEDFMPSTINFDYIDDVIRVNDRECFSTTRRLVREEGLFCGVSSGAAVAGALKYLRTVGAEAAKGGERKNIVVILPDGGRSYLGKVFNDNWMTENGFLEERGGLGRVADILERLGPRELIAVGPDAQLSEVIGLLKVHGISQVPVIEGQKILGILTETRLLERALRGDPRETVRALVQADYCVIREDTDVAVLSELFRKAKAAIVIGADNAPKNILTRIDVIDHLAARPQA